jgi:molecular chaperone HscB
MTADLNHFERLGVPAAPDVDMELAERNYLRLSREIHPDFQRAGDEAAAEHANEASARLNEAWAVISDPAARAEYLLELQDPGVMDRSKTLSPAFLGEAMDLSEEAEAARRNPQAATRLRMQVQADVSARLAEVLDPAAWHDPDTGRLAVALHEIRVLQRVLRDLGGPR